LEEGIEALTSNGEDESERFYARSEASGHLHHLQRLKAAFFLLMCGDILERLSATSKALLAVSIDFDVVAERYASLTKGRPGLVVAVFALRILNVRK
jgi:hypothetical protein